jgi:hypothetical protein
MELAILVGVVAGVVAVYSLVARYFPLYEETVAYKRPAATPPEQAMRRSETQVDSGLA